MTHRAQADIEIKGLPERNVQRTDSLADRRRQRSLDGDAAVANRLDRFIGEPCALAVNPVRLFSGKDLHPRDFAFSAVSFFHGGVPDVHTCLRDVRADTVTFDVSNDRLIGDIENPLRFQCDLFSGGNLYLVISHVFINSS